jgi:UDP-N-acetylglucosamine 2-epimerase
MQILTIVGARPQFIKASTISRRLNDPQFFGLSESILHTGQHYDDEMSGAFFRELGIPEPCWNLGVAKGSHGEQVGRMLVGLEKVLAKARPDLILVYGDTNSTLAGALVAAKAAIPLAHVEAGLRSFRRGMPEEVNRVVTDRLSDFLFCPTVQSIKNLEAESRAANAYLVGDVMFDAFLRIRSAGNDGVLERHGVQPRRFVLATIHRAESTDNPERLAALFGGLGEASKSFPVLLPLHPRTTKYLAEWGIEPAPGIRIVDPLPHGDLIALVSEAAAVATDSGGLQKEAYFASVPCVTLRDETEWLETLSEGWNVLAELTKDGVAGAVLAATARPRETVPPQIFGDGDAAGKILSILARQP